MKLYTGNRWSKETKTNLQRNRAIDQLKAAAAAENLDGKQVVWWLTSGYAPWAILDDKFMTQFVEAPRAILADTVDVTWRLFESQRDALLELNQAIAKAFARGDAEQWLK